MEKWTFLLHWSNFVKAYKYKFQGQERQDELGLNWDSFKWRNYDPAIGRFMCIDPLAMDYTYNSPYAFQENKMGLGRELEGLELHYSSASEIVNNTGFRPIVNAVKDLSNSVMSLFSSAEPEKQKVSTEKINVSLSTDNGGDENQKTTGPALDFMNVTSVVVNMGAFAGLPGGKSKNGMTDAKIGNTASNMKEKAELFKEGKDAATKVDETATKGRKVLVEYVDGYRSVSTQNASETAAKKDSTNKAELGYKVIIERPKKDEAKNK
ncbi:RHS repeat domain-containing protein [Flavobacterium sp. ZT3R17]|uniref:RHS repeat domain-containing protein n=1 Tax=Flavobacterium cryoconiti TaxID=3398736 RepID=UPI003A8735FA